MLVDLLALVFALWLIYNRAKHIIKSRADSKNEQARTSKPDS